MLSRIDLDLMKYSTEGASSEAPKTSPKAQGAEGLGLSFEDLLKESMIQVNSLEQHSDTMMKRMKNCNCLQKIFSSISDWDAEM
mgnify:CR=1 FL=1